MGGVPGAPGLRPWWLWRLGGAGVDGAVGGGAEGVEVSWLGAGGEAGCDGVDCWGSFPLFTSSLYLRSKNVFSYRIFNANHHIDLPTSSSGNGFTSSSSADFPIIFWTFFLYNSSLSLSRFRRASSGIASFLTGVCW